jgi:hypothetical protein
MEWKNDRGSDVVSDSGDTLSVLYEGSDYGEQYTINTDRWYDSCSSSSVDVASVKKDFSRPPSMTDSEKTEFLFDLNRVTDVNPDYRGFKRLVYRTTIAAVD